MIEEDKGFSYESPDKLRRSAVKLLLIELIVLGIIITFIVGLLQYLGFVDVIGMITQNQQTALQVEEKRGPKEPKGVKPTIYNTRNTESTSVSPAITIISDINEITIKEIENGKLLTYLNEFDVFGKKYLLEPGKFSDFVEKLEIHLTNSDQGSNKVLLGSNIPVTSSSISFEGRTLILKIYLSNEAFNNPKVTPEKFFMQSLLSNVYQMQNDPSGIGLNQTQQKELNDLITELYQDKTEYVTISNEK